MKPSNNISPLKKIFLLLLLLCIAAFAGAQKNLVNNNSFEDELYDWNIYGATTTPWVKKEGKAAAVIISYDDKKWVGMEQQIALSKTVTAIEISTWLKTDNVITGTESWKKALMKAEFLDAADKLNGESITIAAIDGNTEWVLYKKTVKVPAGTKKVKLMFAMAFATGTMFIDEVSCRAIPIAQYEAESKGEVYAPDKYFEWKSSKENKTLGIISDAAQNPPIIGLQKEKAVVWQIDKLPNTYYKISEAKTNKALALMNDTLTLQTWMGDDAQQWSIIWIKENIECRIINKITAKPLIIAGNEVWVKRIVE
jgi:hypothetical protein